MCWKSFSAPRGLVMFAQTAVLFALASHETFKVMSVRVSKLALPQINIYEIFKKKFWRVDPFRVYEYSDRVNRYMLVYYWSETVKQLHKRLTLVLVCYAYCTSTENRIRYIRICNGNCTSIHRILYHTVTHRHTHTTHYTLHALSCRITPPCSSQGRCAFMRSLSRCSRPWSNCFPVLEWPQMPFSALSKIVLSYHTSKYWNSFQKRWSPCIFLALRCKLTTMRWNTFQKIFEPKSSVKLRSWEWE